MKICWFLVWSGMLCRVNRGYKIWFNVTLLMLEHLWQATGFTWHATGFIWHDVVRHTELQSDFLNTLYNFRVYLVWNASESYNLKFVPVWNKEIMKVIQVCVYGILVSLPIRLQAFLLHIILCLCLFSNSHRVFAYKMEQS